MKSKDKQIQGLAKVLMLAKHEDELVGLLHDLFTESEISKVHERVKIFACIKDGMSQREAVRESNTAIATVNHGAKFLKNSAIIIRQILDSAQKMNWWYPLFWRA